LSTTQDLLGPHRCFARPVTSSEAKYKIKGTWATATRVKPDWRSTYVCSLKPVFNPVRLLGLLQVTSMCRYSRAIVLVHTSRNEKAFGYPWPRSFRARLRSAISILLIPLLFKRLSLKQSMKCKFKRPQDLVKQSISPGRTPRWADTQEIKFDKRMLRTLLYSSMSS
jgi:hypothetical protein